MIDEFKDKGRFIFFPLPPHFYLSLRSDILVTLLFNGSKVFLMDGSLASFPLGEN